MTDNASRDSAASGRWRRDFRFVWAAESASLLGSQVLQLALPLTAVVTLDANAKQLGFLGAASYAPYLLFAIPAGLLVDRWQRRGVLIASNALQAVAIGTIPVLAATHRLTFAWLLAMAGVAGIGKVFFNIAHRSYLPAIVPTEHLTGANSRLTASESVAEVGGPGLAGLLVQVIGAPFALLVDAVSYLASAVGVAAVRTREKAALVDRSTPLRTQMGQGFRLIFRNPYLRAFLGEAASYNLCWQVVQTVLVIFAVRTLGMSPGTLGLMMSIGAIGALLGATVTGRAAARFGLGKTLVAAAVLGDLAPLILPATQRGMWAAPILATAFFVQGFGITACNVHGMSVRQTVTPDHLLGRTNAAYSFVAQGVQMLGALLGGWLGAATGTRGALLIGTLGLLSTSLFLILSPLRHVRTLKDVAEPDSRLCQA
ncbi:MFS transporter [Calidifontibacter indicus]|uniref:Putative MFS family arabinose efflux permease n=1 Tax=Calidifontibacter indicus TaxID=419650 RepID=A0A3D9U545_9MICO|nr:MFS transporter [Calidifontibacter indicus]REF24608.1 putative MFS family arabinose efflux permease [Calidifontibacter indicus]